MLCCRERGRQRTMGKSSASCFKIIACGSDSVDHDDIQASAEGKGSSGRGWSFRKKSARHRVLNNNVNSETPSSAIKESPESTPISYQAHPDSTLPEKTSVIQWTEENTELPSQVNPKVSDKKTAGEDVKTENVAIDESSIIIIQAAVRGWLVRTALLKKKNIIKLQAAVRGHLVRSHAVGTLRCVQAIIKMQALVRARRARILEAGSRDLGKHTESNGKDNNDPTLLKKKEAAKPAYAYISIEKLLSNRFARQLMESTPRTKPIYIKCDPLKSDSAWKWLERWMSVSPVSSDEPQESRTVAKQQDEEDLGRLDSKKDVLVSSEFCSKATGIKSSVAATAQASENDDNMIAYDGNNFDSHALQSIAPPTCHVEVQKIEVPNSTNDIPESAPTEIKETDPILKVEAISPQDFEETEKEGIPDLEKISTEQTEAEAKRFSRKASNPSFIAAQSKFEELSSAATSVKLANSISHDPSVETSLDEGSSFSDKPVRSSKVGLAENSIPHTSSIQVFGSDCGTELSISSTLDSSDRSEFGIKALEQEPKVSDEAVCPRTAESVMLEDNGTSSRTEIYPSHADTDQLERFETANSAFEESVSSVVAVDSSQLEKNLEADPSDVHLQLASEGSHLVYKSSPEASPRSHTTVPESQATPSSQVSVKPKKSRGDRSDSNGKKRTSSSNKKSVSNGNQDSASRSSVEQLPEHKSGKRRNSLGSAKPDHVEEPRDSSSSNSLPSYMQATESARAKAITNGSPRSSPDVHDKDIYIKKRHSLPGTNGRQGSPRIQRSLSQAQQNVKGNGTQSPQERKWRR